MSKYKIIECSRFTRDEMKSAKGGLCHGTHIVACVDVHGECISVPAGYGTDLCAEIHGTCALGAVYREYCASVHQSCGFLTTYSF